MQVSGQSVEFSIRKQEENMSDSSSAVPKLKLPSRFESSDYRLVDVRGIPQNPSFTVSRFESIIDTFQTRDGDVFLSTFVKAGILLNCRAQSLVLSIRLFLKCFVILICFGKVTVNCFADIKRKILTRNNVDSADYSSVASKWYSRRVLRRDSPMARGYNI